MVTVVLFHTSPDGTLLKVPSSFYGECEMNSEIVPKTETYVKEVMNRQTPAMAVAQFYVQ